MRWLRSPFLAAIVAVVGLSLLAAGCGGGSPPGVANVGSSTVSSAAGSSVSSHSNTLLIAGRCLRENGLTNFPDPTIATSGPAEGDAILDKGSLRAFSQSVVTHAVAACNSALQKAGIGSGSQTRTPQEIQYGLAFSRCVRQHGISDFPDPNGQGQFDLAGTGINKNNLTPAQLAAVRACLPVAHGTINVPQQDAGTAGSGG